MNFGQAGGVQGLRGGDEYRIAGWMRLMPGDVEVADAKREVDRVEVFECGRKKRQVKREEQPGGERAGKP